MENKTRIRYGVRTDETRRCNVNHRDQVEGYQGLQEVTCAEALNWNYM